MSTSLSKTLHVERSRNSRSGGGISAEEYAIVPEGVVPHMDLATGLDGILKRSALRDGAMLGECRSTERQGSNRKNTIGCAKACFCSSPGSKASWIIDKTGITPECHRVRARRAES